MRLRDAGKLLPAFMEIPKQFRSHFCVTILFGQSVLRDPLPWIPYRAIEFLNATVKPNSKVFEYGSGCSTLYWLRMGCSLVSVEHDAAYYHYLKPYIQSGTCQYILREPSEVPHASMSFDPTSYVMFQSADSHRLSYEDYVRTIESYPDFSFDVVFIDGRARPSCIFRAIAKVANNGMLVLDNSDRSYYLRQTLPLLANWKRYDFAGTVAGSLQNSQTSVWVRT